MKIISYVVGALVLVGFAFYALNGYIYQEKQAEEAPVVEQIPDVVDATFYGTVTEVNFEQVALDGPSLIAVTVIETGETRTVAVPSMGLPQCAAAASIADPFQLAPGDTVSVRGLVRDTGEVVPCDNQSHFLEASRTEEKTEAGITFTYKKGPNGYVLEENTRTSSDEAAELTYSAVFTNTAAYAEFVQSEDARESPENFEVRVYENSARLGPTQWAQAYNTESNITLAIETPVAVTVAGASGITYTADGLYPIKTYVVGRGEYVYVFAGMFDPSNTTMSLDYSNFMALVSFLAVAATPLE